MWLSDKLHTMAAYMIKQPMISSMEYIGKWERGSLLSPMVKPSATHCFPHIESLSNVHLHAVSSAPGHQCQGNACAIGRWRALCHLDSSAKCSEESKSTPVVVSESRKSSHNSQFMSS